MSLATRTVERFRSRLTRFVEKERKIAGNAKDAVKAVARKIGMSSVNVYRAMNGYGPVTIHAHQYVALLMASLKPIGRAKAKVAHRWARARAISHPENVAAP